MRRIMWALLIACCFPAAARADLKSGFDALAQNRYDEAFRTLLPYAKQGNADAEWAVGTMYHEGLGAPRDVEEGCRWMQRSAKQGNQFGEFSFAHCFAESGAKHNQREATRWYRKSAEQGFGEAEAALGIRYLNGGGIERDLAAGIGWLRKAVDQSNAMAMDGLGHAYERGVGVSVDLAQAYAWYKLAVAHERDPKRRSSYETDLAAAGGNLSPEARSRGDRLASAWRPAQAASTSASSAGADAKRPMSLTAALIGALDTLGYDAGPMRDRLDGQGRTAIRAFQHDHGLPESGRPSKRLVAAVRDALQRKHGTGDGDGRQVAASGALRLRASGTGFVISASGHVLTNHHVIDGCREMRVGDHEVVDVLAIDQQADLAILKLRHPRPNVATFRDGSNARPGEDIVVLGYPLHQLLGSDPIITTGTINALAGPRDDRTLIQISAPVQPGNSGGPVLDSSGNVVGVVVSGLDALRVAKATGTIPENVNFAINEATARRFLDAHQVSYNRASTERLAAPDVASRASTYTLLLECFQ